MNNTQSSRINNPGNFAIETNKLRIFTGNRISSILFEDISSITCVSCEKKRANEKIFYIGLSVSLLIIILTLMIENEIFMIFGITILVLSIIISSLDRFKRKTQWDNIIIETRGGQIFIYSVGQGLGITHVDQIEAGKRLYAK